MKREIRLCGANDLFDLQRFLDEHWRKGHILSWDLELLDFLHKNKTGGYNFVIAKVDSEIVAVKGFIPTSQFDSALESEKEIWSCLWKNIGDPGIGMCLYSFMGRGQKTVSSVGISNDSWSMFSACGYTVGCLNHYYMLNHNCRNFKIAKIIDPPRSINCDGKSSELVLLTPETLMSCGVVGVYRPRKTLSFFNRRYFEHPIYKYRLFGVRDMGEDRVKVILATRIVECQESRCMHIVDCLGDLSSCLFLGDAFQRLMSEDGIEYIDCLNYGISESVFSRIGMEKLDDGNNIIPEYFEPFVQKNINVRFGFQNYTDEPYVIFKGDADQDRPSRR